MSILQAFLLGILQGLTEFIPISSSGHLVLAESYFKLDVEALKSFDIAVHFGTLIAIFIYFRRDFLKLFKGAIYLVFRKKIGRTHDAAEPEESGQLVKFLLLATVPALIIGAFFGDFLDNYFRNVFSVAIFMIIVGVYFFLAEYIAARNPKSSFNWLNTMLIGVAQACALIPGISRSGSTISTGLMAGIKREESAKFSFLLGSIAIAAAFALSLIKVIKGDLVITNYDVIFVGIISSFASGYAAIAFLMRFLKKHTLHIFGLYRVILGFAILYFLIK
jgi:undecaprenyl-diphosphatase